MAKEVHRRLAAILAADVVGYSRLIGEDEAGTLAALRAHREELIEPALGDANRVAILADLAAGGAPRTVSEIAKRLPVDLSVVSRHLAMLREAGVLAAERRGKEVYYTVRYEGLAGTLRAIADAIDACCPAASATKEDVTHG